MSAITSATGTEEILKIFNAPITGYWESHYHFGKESPGLPTMLSLSSKRILAINVAAPILYAWGSTHNLRRWQDAAVALLQDIPAESNSITHPRPSPTARMATGCPVGTFSGQSGQCPHLSTQFSDRTPHLQAMPPRRMRRYNPVKRNAPAEQPRQGDCRPAGVLNLNLSEGCHPCHPSHAMVDYSAATARLAGAGPLPSRLRQRADISSRVLPLVSGTSL